MCWCSSKVNFGITVIRDFNACKGCCFANRKMSDFALPPARARTVQYDDDDDDDPPPVPPKRKSLVAGLMASRSKHDSKPAASSEISSLLAARASDSSPEPESPGGRAAGPASAASPRRSTPSGSARKGAHGHRRLPGDEGAAAAVSPTASSRRARELCRAALDWICCNRTPPPGMQRGRGGLLGLGEAKATPRETCERAVISVLL